MLEGGGQDWEGGRGKKHPAGMSLYQHHGYFIQRGVKTLRNLGE